MTPNNVRFWLSSVPRARCHLETNPLVRGMPTMLSEASENAAMVHGMRLAKPDNWLISVLCADT